MRYALPPAVAMLIAAFAASEPTRPEGNLHRISVFRLHDADTISDCNISLGFGVALQHQSIRLAGFDAWEINRTRRTVEVTDEEIALGKEARDALKALLLEGEAYIVPENERRDAYGRLLGSLWIWKDNRWLEVAAWAKARGYTRDSN